MRENVFSKSVRNSHRVPEAFCYALHVHARVLVGAWTLGGALDAWWCGRCAASIPTCRWPQVEFVTRATSN